MVPDKQLEEMILDILYTDGPLTEEEVVEKIKERGYIILEDLYVN